MASCNRRTGSIIMLLVASFFIISLLAFVIDIGFMYFQNARINTAVNASWKGGYDLLSGLRDGLLTDAQKEQVRQRVREIMVENGFSKDEVASKTAVLFFDNDRGFEVAASASFGLFFARVMGFQIANVYSRRDNLITDPLSGKKYAPRLPVPIAIPHAVVKDISSEKVEVSPLPSEGFKPGREYILKPGSDKQSNQPEKIAENIQTTSTSTEEIKVVSDLSELENDSSGGIKKNNFGIVELDNISGGGAEKFRKNLLFGCNKPLEVNHRIIIDSNSYSDICDEAIKLLVSSDTASAAVSVARVILPVVDVPPEVSGHNNKAVYEIACTDNPAGKSKLKDYQFKSSLRIIGFAEFEIIPPSKYSRAGTKIEQGDNGDLGPALSGQIRGKFLKYVVVPGEIKPQ
ncbi:MAG: hypothetical protein HQM10_22235 [Candidatus Riflebacteria bacterium]|nr:hypothetical protein [Candidatus Riflebacteria bacterium]